MDHRWKDCGRDRLLASDPDLATFRIGHELDVPYGLLQFIENGDAPSHQRPAVHRRIEALRPAIKQPHSERVFKVSKALRCQEICA